MLQVAQDSWGCVACLPSALPDLGEAADPEYPVQCATRDFGGYVLSSATPELVRVRPVDAGLPAGATEDSTKALSADLAAGILNQFGLTCQLARYRI